MKGMRMTTLYARKLTSREDIPREPPAPGYVADIPPCMGSVGDVALYHDPARTKFYCVFPGHYSNCPTSRSKRVRINNVQYQLKWS